MRAAVFAACVGVAVSASFGSVVVYNLSDHPDGDVNPPSYGLRADGIYGPHDTVTFSMDHFADTRLVVIDNGSSLKIRIRGTLYGGAIDLLGGYVAPEIFHLDVSYVVDVQSVSNGWMAYGEHAADAGAIIRDDGFGSPSVLTSDLYSLSSKMDGTGVAFAFLADGHRLPDNTTWVGRGWFMPFADGWMGGTRDFLFTGSLVPSPGAMGLLGLGSVIAGRRRR